MEAVLGQVEQLPALLAVSRSALVRDWDSLTLDRALEWARYFQHLHERFRARPQLREALARRLRRSQPCPLLGFPALGRCPQLLGLALLENRALSPAACRRLLRSLLQPPGAGPASDPRGLPLLARRKAAARLLAVPRRAPGPEPEPEPQLQAEARLLLSRLRQEERGAGDAAGQQRRLSGVQEEQRAGEAAGQQRRLSGVQEEQRAGEASGQQRRLSGVQEEQRAGEAAGQLRWLSGVQEEQRAGEAAGQLRWLSGALELLPQPRAFGVVAAALALLKQGPGAEQAGDGDRDGSSSPDGYEEAADGCTAGLLLSWLLGNQERFSAFCLGLPGSHLAFLAGHYSQLSRSYLDLLTGWGRHLHYDPLQGRWVKSCLDKAELSWEELRERFICLCQGSTLLREQTQAALELLRTQDGDFKVRGLSVWADLLMEVGY